MKRIAITQRVEIVQAHGERRDCLSQEWGRLFDRCGFIPIVIPNSSTLVEMIMGGTDIDGVLLTGGNDLVNYGGDAPERDETERWLIDRAVECGMPLLGVCRGMQLLLDYFGTPLQRVENHVGKNHEVSGIFGEKIVNSFHNFGCFECSPELEVVCRARDNVIEAVRGRGLFGLMWHIERYAPLRDEDISFLKEFYR